MLMLVWLENNLFVLGLLAMLAGLAAGAVLTRSQRTAGIIDSRGPSGSASGDRRKKSPEARHRARSR